MLSFVKSAVLAHTVIDAVYMPFLSCSSLLDVLCVHSGERIPHSRGITQKKPVTFNYFKGSKSGHPQLCMLDPIKLSGSHIYNNESFSICSACPHAHEVDCCCYKYNDSIYIWQWQIQGVKKVKLCFLNAQPCTR